MPKVTTAELQFCLALMGRMTDQARTLAWRTACNGRQVACDVDGFRLHLGPTSGGDGVEISVSDRDGWPMLHVVDTAFPPGDAHFVRSRFSEMLAVAVSSSAAPVEAKAAASVVPPPPPPALHPAEEVRLAHLVRRLGASQPEASRPRRWFPRPTWGLSPEVVPLTGSA